jgi:hypothetical protein
LAVVLGRRWGIVVASMEYRAVGFGSHHWEIIDSQQERWFVTVDELACKGSSQGEPEDAAFQRLRAALRTARDLRDNGRTFVVAPVLTLDGEPLVRMNGPWGVALYPYVEGDSFVWGEFSTPAHRRGVLDLIVELHGAPPAAFRHALVDDFGIPNRDVLELGCQANGDVWDGGPYGLLTSTLLLENAEGIRRLLLWYDDLVKEARRLSRPMVLTHGEPHPGNTMLRPEGWLLIDWDTTLVAPPERDLWSIDPGDGSVLGAYAGATGITPLPAMLDLYRLRWDLADIAVGVRQFSGTHSGTVDDEKSWDVLCSLVARLAPPTG